MNALPFRPALSLARLLRRRKLGARELLDLCWARVEKYNGAVNAIVVSDIERALAGVDPEVKQAVVSLLRTVGRAAASVPTAP